MNRLLGVVLLTSAVALPLGAQQQWTSGVYVYDSSGNVVQMGTDQYRYDGVSRVKQATAGRTQGQSNGQQSYGYDSFGNRVSATTCYGATCSGGPLSTSAATNHLADGTTYNDAGAIDASPRGGVQHQYAYDPAGMMSAQTATGKTVQYVYTADDQRLAVETSGEWQWSLRNIGQQVSRDVESNDAPSSSWTATEDYVNSDRGLTGDVSPAGRRHAHLDHEGTPRVFTDEMGRRLGEHSYFAFGEELATGSESPKERLKFAGQERDEALGGDALDYEHARYYDSAIGRFMSADAWHSAGPLTTGQSWNRYAYVNNDPLRYTDPDGRLRKDAFNSLVMKPHGPVEERLHVAAPGHAFKFQPVYLYADDGAKIEAFFSVDNDPRMQTDCHGLTFAEGRVWIDNDQVPRLLQHDGYAETKTPAAGDVGVYYDGNAAVHSVTVESVDDQGNVQSVVGLGGIQMAARTALPQAGPGGGWWNGARAGQQTVRWYHKRSDHRSASEISWWLRILRHFRKK